MRTAGLWIIFALNAAVLAQSTETVTGTVTDTAEAAIGDAHVKLYSGAETVAEGTTDRWGEFHLRSIPAGRYRLVIEDPGFKARTMDHVRVEAGLVTSLSAIVLEIAPVPGCPPGETAPELKAERLRPGTRPAIYGGIVDADDRPIAGAEIVLFRANSRKPAARTVSDADGSFVLANLRPGSCRLVITLRSHADFIIERVPVKRDSAIRIRPALAMRPCPESGPCGPAYTTLVWPLCL